MENEDLFYLVAKRIVGDQEITPSIEERVKDICAVVGPVLTALIAKDAVEDAAGSIVFMHEEDDGVDGQSADFNDGRADGLEDAAKLVAPFVKQYG